MAKKYYPYSKIKYLERKKASGKKEYKAIIKIYFSFFNFYIYSPFKYNNNNNLTLGRYNYKSNDFWHENLDFLKKEIPKLIKRNIEEKLDRTIVEKKEIETETKFYQLSDERKAKMDRIIK